MFPDADLLLLPITTMEILTTLESLLDSGVQDHGTIAIEMSKVPCKLDLLMDLKDQVDDERHDSSVIRSLDVCCLKRIIYIIQEHTYLQQ
jgi:hypothetical protein